MNYFSRKRKKRRKSSAQVFGWTAFAVVLLSLLIYGLSFFAAAPTVETITTQPAPAETPSSSSDVSPDGETPGVKYRKHKRRR